MAGRLTRLGIFVFSVGAALNAFDARLWAIRKFSSVQHDSLVNFNMLLAWIRHGDSPRGFTLTPSPYFVDLALQLPLALLAPDFERFSYALAFTYAVLILAAVYAVLRLLTEHAIVIASLAVGLFYTFAPIDFVVHVFVVNHTSELIETLGLLALLSRWSRLGEKWVGVLYAALVALFVMSSPFFIATFCLPAMCAIAVVSLKRTRLAWFYATTLAGISIGAVALAFVARYVWPIRGDHYGHWQRSYHLFVDAVRTEPGGLLVAIATTIAVIASCVLFVVGRRRRWRTATVFALAFYPACTAMCVVLPIKRGAFDGAYAFRYVTLPWLMTIAFYLVVGARALALLWRRFSPQEPYLRIRPWSAALLAAAGVALLATCHGALSIDSDDSLSAPLVNCFHDADARGDLLDGVATWWTARYMNAARLAWGSPHVVVQSRTSSPPSLDPVENNVMWFDGTYRGGATMNFVSTHSLDDAQRGFYLDALGAPDRKIACPTPINLRPDGKDTFEFWIWDKPEAQRKLAELFLRDNLRSPFASPIGATSMDIDLARGTHRVANMLVTYPQFVPSGRYRLDVDLEVPVAAKIVVRLDGHGVRASTLAAPGTHHVSLPFSIKNLGATSGMAMWIEIEDASVAKITLTLVDQDGMAPLQIFGG